MDLSFYKGKRILLTGHTGFKGTWLTKILVNAGAELLGYSRCSEKHPNFFAMSGVEQAMQHVKGDVRDYAHLKEVFSAFRPEIVFHLAAQPIVRESYEAPLYTYETNTMGTVNVLECIRKTDSVQSALIVTTDKVYRNEEQGRSFREDDVLDGFEPYSNSKSCAELAAASYRRSFPHLPPISTARAGNVIGGGDFATDRIIPDCVRAAQNGQPIIVRNPHSIRPYQHVLEPLFAYLLIAEKQTEDPALAGCYNVGPEERDCITTGELVDLFCKNWGEGLHWIDQSDPNAPHEAGFLQLDSSRIRSMLNWQPRWNILSCMEMTCRFYKVWMNGENVAAEMDAMIQSFMEA